MSRGGGCPELEKREMWGKFPGERVSAVKSKVLDWKERSKSWAEG